MHRSILLCAGLLLAALPASAQSVEKISPVVECIGQKADGTYYAWYGYYNRNSTTITTPVGSGSSPRYVNSFKGGADRGQPTEFLPGRQRHVFRIEYTAADGGHGDTWILRAAGARHQATATAGTNARPDCIYDRSGADLSLTSGVDNATPEVGETVTATVALRNDGPATATGIEVSLGLLPPSVTPLSFSATTGTASEVGWTVGALDANSTATLTVVLQVDQPDAFSLDVEVAAANEADGDSSPGNRATDEDDYTLLAVTPTASSGGTDGGLESDGSLATLLGQRALARHLDAAEARRTGRTEAPLLALREAPVSRTTRGSALDLRSLLPAEGPSSTEAFVTTPEDLLRITNAKALLAADYLQTDGDRAGVVLAAFTPAGETYDHTKAICDRVKGSRLESIGLVPIAGGDFVLLHVVRPDGRVDYAVSFVAYPESGRTTIDSRFRAEEYAIAQGQPDDVLNVQVWGASPDVAVALAADVIARLEAQVNAEFRNAGVETPALPSVFVRGGTYVPGALALDIANTTGAAQTVTLSGTTTDVEEGERDAFEQTLAVPAAGLQTTLNIAGIFDLGFSVVADEVTDYVYLADGVWTYTSGDPTDELRYTVTAGGRAPETGLRPVERNARLVGTTSSWAGLFRSIQAGSRPADLTAFDHLVFEARGTGRVQVLVNKELTNGLEPFHVWIDLTDTYETFEVPFESLRRGDGTTRFSAEDVTLVAFYTYDEGGAPTPFDVDVQNVRFEQSALVSSEEGARARLDLGVAPNPSRGLARVLVTLPEAGDVVVDVVDLLGRRVAVVAERSVAAGPHAFALPEALAPGTYLVRLQTGDAVLTRTVTRVR